MGLYAAAASVVVVVVAAGASTIGTVAVARELYRRTLQRTRCQCDARDFPFASRGGGLLPPLLLLLVCELGGKPSVSLSISTACSFCRAYLARQFAVPVEDDVRLVLTVHPWLTHLTTLDHASKHTRAKGRCYTPRGSISRGVCFASTEGGDLRCSLMIR